MAEGSPLCFSWARAYKGSMIIRKRPGTSASQAGSSHSVDAGTPAIKMWEQVERLGRIFYVPLDCNFNPIGDLALEDSDEVSNRLAQSFQIVPSVEAPPEWDERIEGLVVQMISELLTRRDATTYEVYEMVFAELQASGALDAGASIDLSMLLPRNFNCYEFENDRGTVLRKWTLDEVNEDEAEIDVPDTLSGHWETFIKNTLN